MAAERFTERDEELLEALYIRNIEENRYGIEGLEELAERLGVLEEKGMIEGDGDKVRLTSLGIDAGAKVVRRHRLAERLISDVFGSGEDLMHERACKFEHIIDRGLDESICTLLGHPAVCPHGKPIPRGPCCEADTKEVGKLVTTLDAMEPDQQGTIAYLHSADRGILNKLMALGVVPGSPVQLIQSRPSYAFQAGESQFAVDREIAASIYVRLRPSLVAADRRKRRRRRGLDAAVPE